MGAGASSGLSQDQPALLAKKSKFTEQQIKLLWKRFSALDATDRGYITEVEFKNLPELIFNPMVDRILQVVRSRPSWTSASDGSSFGRRKSRALPGEAVDFVLFVQSLDAFHPNWVISTPAAMCDMLCARTVRMPSRKGLNEDSTRPQYG